MENTSEPVTQQSGFFGTVNDILGAVNNFGTTAISLRERYQRTATPTGYAVPTAQGSQAGQVAAVAGNNGTESGMGLADVPRWLLVGSALLVAGVVAYKLLRG